MNINEVIKIARFTVLIGKNGPGKVRYWYALNNGDHVKYGFPERGGTLKYDPNAESSIVNDSSWLKKPDK